MLVVLATLAASGAARAQDRAERVGAGDVVATVAAGAVFLSPHLLKLNESPPACAPCDRQRVPAFDRWAIVEPRGAEGAASGVLLAGLAALAWADALDDGAAGRAEIAASVAATSWALGTTELLKAIAARKRPVLYTGEAAAAAGILTNQRSWPSGHAAAAFALATSYVLSRETLETPRARLWAALGAAAGVGVLRVAAGRHFPSDVVSGAAIGTASALIVREIKF